MKTRFLFLALLLLGGNAIVLAQNKDKDIKEKANVETERLTTSADDKIYEKVDENAQFPGGDEECFKWLAEHIKYPAIAEENGVQGRVIVNFVVETNGSVSDIKVVRSPDSSLSREAERLLKMMPKWKPARLGNKAVRSRFTLPVMFRWN